MIKDDRRSNRCDQSAKHWDRRGRASVVEQRLSDCENVGARERIVTVKDICRKNNAILVETYLWEIPEVSGIQKTSVTFVL